MTLRSETTSKDEPYQVTCTVKARIPSSHGEFDLYLYNNNKDRREHLAFVFGEQHSSISLEQVRENETDADRILRGAAVRQPKLDRLKVSQTLVRIQSECFTGETAGSIRCDCGDQLTESKRLMAERGDGIIVYLRQEGRGIGLADKLCAYNLQDMGFDTVSANLLLRHPADRRTYEAAHAILQDLGVERIRLLTNNPDKIEQLAELGIHVEERVPLVPHGWQTHGAPKGGPSRGAGSSPAPYALPRPASTSSEPHQRPRPLSTTNLHRQILLSTHSAAIDQQELVRASTPPIGSTQPLAGSLADLDSDTDLQRYLKTKAARMRHIIPLPP